MIVGGPLRRVLIIVGVRWIRPAAVVRAGRNAGRHILVDRQDQVLPAHVLIPDAVGAVLPELMFDFNTRLP